MKESERREKEVTREIKFRGKAKMSIEELNELGLKHENGWVYGHLVMYGKTPYIVGDFIEVDSEYTVNEFWIEVISDTVGQFTGLKDKNGKEIYEGDIVCFDGYMTADDSLGFEPNGYIYDKDSVHCVLWDNVLGGWTLNFDEDEEWKYKRDTRCLLCDQKCEVIGNIHDNPELLEVK
jgi:uncharacterized phage protein (TIGR01671 family)